MKVSSKWAARFSVQCAILAAPVVAGAQEPPAGTSPPANAAAAPADPTVKPKSNAQIDAGEPRADTSPDAAKAAASSAAPAAAPAGSSTAAAGSKANGRPAGRTASSGSGSTSGQKGPAASDRLDLDAATVTGDREQPKVMYVVPWKKSDIGDLSGKPMNSLLDEALAPVDRDEFKREVVYYGAMNSDGSGNVAPNKGTQGEK